MADEILGFRKKDVIEMLDDWCGRFDEKELKVEAENQIKEYQNRLVPVVSVELLEKRIKLVVDIMKKKQGIISVSEFIKFCDDLLSAVRKEARKK